jgi:hypothetical protein
VYERETERKRESERVKVRLSVGERVVAIVKPRREFSSYLTSHRQRQSERGREGASFKGGAVEALESCRRRCC